MTSLYDLTFPWLVNALKTEQHLLAQAEKLAAEKGIPIQELLDTRLAPDMWPLSQQAVIVALHSSMTVLKITGTPPNQITFGPASLEDSKKYLAESLELVQAVKPEDVNGKEGSTVTAMMGAGAEANMKALDYVVGYLQPNIYFHLTTTYDILRNKGAAIGKKDFLQSFVRLA